ncbi:MAG: ABC transporter permease [Bacteroidia bacterium]
MEYEIKPKTNLDLGLKELWAYHELFYFFTWRDIKVKYKQTVFGFLWAVLQPLVMVALFTLCLGRLISSSVPLNLPYPVFALSGFLLWNVFSSGLSNAGNSMVSNANIIKKIYFPRLIIPISAILVSLFDFFISFVVFIAVIIYYKTPLQVAALLYIPLSLLLTCISTFGLGALLAALNVKYRDFRYVIPFFIQALMFATPVIYPVRISGSPFIYNLLALNPMTAPIELFRNAFSNAPPDTHLIIISSSVSVILFLTGLIYFRKTESYFADLA